MTKIGYCDCFDLSKSDIIDIMTVFYCNTTNGKTSTAGNVFYLSVRPRLTLDATTGRCCFPIKDERDRASSSSTSPSAAADPKRRPWSRTTKIIFSFQAAARTSLTRLSSSIPPSCYVRNLERHIACGILRLRRKMVNKI